MTQNANPVDETDSRPGNYGSEFEREIAELEQTIAALKHRQADTQLATQEQVVLVRQRNQLKQTGISRTATKQELQLILSGKVHHPARGRGRDRLARRRAHDCL